MMIRTIQHTQSLIATCIVNFLYHCARHPFQVIYGSLDGRGSKKFQTSEEEKEAMTTTPPLTLVITTTSTHQTKTKQNVR